MIKVEPYWNVKLIQGQFSFSDSSIKVEPYWNVKYISETNAPIAYLLK